MTGLDFTPAMLEAARARAATIDADVVAALADHFSDADNAMEAEYRLAAATVR